MKKKKQKARHHATEVYGKTVTQWQLSNDNKASVNWEMFSGHGYEEKQPATQDH